MGEINKIVLLTDYKGFFGSKQKTTIYRGGLDLKKLKSYFMGLGFDVEISSFTGLKSHTVDREKTLILYTSSEDKYGFYKSFIEDMVLHLEQLNFYLIPSYSCLKAHNNKVAMELFRDRSTMHSIKTICSKVFGTFEEFIDQIDDFSYPVVVKPATGAMSRGVAMACNKVELIRNVKNISLTLNYAHALKEILRKVKYKNLYKCESSYRSKFIIQNFVPGLSNDWKILVFGKKCFVLFRGNRANDFRASGSGKFVFERKLPFGMLDFALSIKENFNVPHISLDVGFDGKEFHLIEFQFLYFGTTTVEKSPFYFEKLEDKWLLKEGKTDIEEVYVASIVDFLKS